MPSMHMIIRHILWICATSDLNAFVSIHSRALTKKQSKLRVPRLALYVFASSSSHVIVLPKVHEYSVD